MVSFPVNMYEKKIDFHFDFLDSVDFGFFG
jgi:hypothetical protein